MLLGRHLAVAYILLSLCPVLVMPQLYLKVGVCVVFAGAFVYQGCAENVNIICRLVALQMKIINCRLYPCINYGSNEENTCADFPTGCPLEWIKMFGLCEPFKICCGTGGVVSARKSRGQQALKRLGLLKDNDDKASIANKLDRIPDSMSSKTLWNETFGFGDVDLSHLPPELNLSSDPKDYLKDWPKNTTDPMVVEEAIRSQYNTFMVQMAVINDQEGLNGEEPFNVISFEDYRAVGLGEKEFENI